MSIGPLATARLDLAPMSHREVPWLATHWRRPEVRRHLFDDCVLDDSDVHDLLAPYLETDAWRRRALWVARVRSTAVPVGVFGYSDQISRQGIEVCFSLEPHCRGRGLAGEALAAVLRAFFLATTEDSILGIADADNTRSLALMRRLGFVDAPGVVGDGLVALALARGAIIAPPPS